MNITNRKASFEYHIEDRYVAGLVLRGTEVKSLREGKGNLTDAYCIFEKNELFVRNFHISVYSHGNYGNHEPLAERKLLLSKQELRKIQKRSTEKGFTIVPLRIFLNEKGLIKAEIGLCKGKKMYDKRESIKQKDEQRARERES